MQGEWKKREMQPEIRQEEKLRLLQQRVRREDLPLPKIRIRVRDRHRIRIRVRDRHRIRISSQGNRHLPDNRAERKDIREMKDHRSRDRREMTAEEAFQAIARIMRAAGTISAGMALLQMAADLREVTDVLKEAMAGRTIDLKSLKDRVKVSWQIPRLRMPRSIEMKKSAETARSVTRSPRRTSCTKRTKLH